MTFHFSPFSYYKNTLSRAGIFRYLYCFGWIPVFLVPGTLGSSEEITILTGGAALVLCAPAFIGVVFLCASLCVTAAYALLFEYFEITNSQIVHGVAWKKIYVVDKNDVKQVILDHARGLIELIVENDPKRDDKFEAVTKHAIRLPLCSCAAQMKDFCSWIKPNLPSVAVCIFGESSEEQANTWQASRLSFFIATCIYCLISVYFVQAILR